MKASRAGGELLGRGQVALGFPGKSLLDGLGGQAVPLLDHRRGRWQGAARAAPGCLQSAVKPHPVASPHVWSRRRCRRSVAAPTPRHQLQHPHIPSVAPQLLSHSCKPPARCEPPQPSCWRSWGGRMLHGSCGNVPLPRCMVRGRWEAYGGLMFREVQGGSLGKQGKAAAGQGDLGLVNLQPCTRTPHFPLSFSILPILFPLPPPVSRGSFALPP